MTLSDKWRKGIEGRAEPEVPREDFIATAHRRWADAIIEKIPAELDIAIKLGRTYINIGEFEDNETEQSKGNYYPRSAQLRGGALLLYEYCEKEGLHLFVHAYNQRGPGYMGEERWDPPYWVSIHLTRKDVKKR